MLALDIHLGAVRRSTRLDYAKRDVELFENSRLELQSTVEVDLLGDAVTRNLFGSQNVCDSNDALILDWGGLCLASKAINHRQDRSGDAPNESEPCPPMMSM